jgi:hypothetical protein
MRSHPLSASASGQSTVIARSCNAGMGSLGRSPQRRLGQAGRTPSALGRACRFTLCCVVWLLLLSAALVRAQATPDVASAYDTLTLDAGSTCLDRARLIERVARWRERDSLESGIEVHVRGDSELPTRVFFSVVRAGTAPTERMLDNAPIDCDQLHSAVALSIALAVDAILSGDRSGRAPKPIVKPTPPSAAENAPPRRRAVPDMYLEFDLLAGASVGVVPNTAGALLPRLQLAVLPWLSFVVAGIATHSSGASVQDTPGTFSSSLLAAGLDVCLGGETETRLSFFTCVGARGGSFVTEANGYSTNQKESRRWWAVSASGQARAWLLPYLALGISVEALFALADRELVVVGDRDSLPTRMRALPRVGLSIAGGPVFRFF